MGKAWADEFRADKPDMVLTVEASGIAMAVAAAIDSMHFEGVVGCIAGDDTIFCAVKTEEETIKLADKIHKLTANKKVW